MHKRALIGGKISQSNSPWWDAAYLWCRLCLSCRHIVSWGYQLFICPLVGFTLHQLHFICTVTLHSANIGWPSWRSHLNLNLCQKAGLLLGRGSKHVPLAFWWGQTPSETQGLLLCLVRVQHLCWIWKAGLRFKFLELQSVIQVFFQSCLLFSSIY